MISLIYKVKNKIKTNLTVTEMVVIREYGEIKKKRSREEGKKEK